MQRLKQLLAITCLLIAGTVLSAYIPAAHAQQITSTPGSPSATTTIEGDHSAIGAT
jgi:hypothetical protein